MVVQLRGANAAFGATSVAIPHDCILPREHTTEDAEIAVFNAEKYFNESLAPDIEPQKKGNLDALSVVKEQPLIATPSIRSESSCISQTALLHSLLRNQQQRRGRRKNILAAIVCRCSCRDKDSVSIDDMNAKKCPGNRSEQRNKSSSDDSVNNSDFKLDQQEMRDDSNVHFSFPVFNPKIGNEASQGRASSHNPARMVNLMARNSIAAWPDDSDSDASSDLFEIESLSMQESDGCITPRAGYAPSEVSIEWSVVTASAVDFSALSDTEEVRSNAVAATPQPQKLEMKPKMPKRRSGILSGCRNHKAVDVAGSHSATVAKALLDNRKPPTLKFLTPVTRLLNKEKDNMPGFDSRSRHCILSKPHHESAPRLLYT